MSTRDEKWPAGTPSWADCQVDDPAAAAEFYSALFGWTAEASEDPQYGGYRIGEIGGRAVAGIGSKQDPNQPSVWTTYLAVDSADDSAAAAAAAGGQVLAPPFDVGPMGRMAVCSAPDGSVYGVWQAGEHLGAGVVNEPGAMCWNELHTKAYDQAKAFYGTVFGWTYTDIGDENFTYSTIELDGRGIGGVMLDSGLPEGMPNYWLAWFAVDNCDAVVAKATGLGSSVLMPPMDSPFGRSAVVAGPQGEVFAVIDMSTATGADAGAG